MGGKEACGCQHLQLERALALGLLFEDSFIAADRLLTVGSRNVVVPGRGVKTLLCDLSDICYRDGIRHLWV